MSHGKLPVRCELAVEKPSRGRKGCGGALAYEGKYLLCQEHRDLADRIAAASNRKINAIRNERRVRKAA